MPGPIALTIAGSDSSGSSGLQADLPTFAALGVHGTSVVTVVTAQNSLGVASFHPLSPELVAAQLASLTADLAPAATKTGLLLDPEVVQIVAAAAVAGQLGHLVLDPVLADSSGRTIVSDETVTAYRALVRHAAICTPNRWEAELLLERSLHDTDAVVAAAADLRRLGAQLVVVTGGRGDDDEAVDVIVATDDVTVLRSPRVGEVAIRGTGCTFSAATAARVAAGDTPRVAVEAAAAFVQAQLQRTEWLQLGAGRPGIPHHIGP